MLRCMKKTRILKVRRDAARLIDLNKYLASFPRSTMSDKMVVTEINEILLNSMPNSWSKQMYVQGFDCKYIYFKKAVKTFDCMKISETIY